MTYTRKVAYNTFVQVISRVIIVIISLVIIGVLTRYLGVEGFGKYATALAFVTFFGIFADLGFFFILVREISAGSRQIEKIVSNVMTIRVGAAILAYGLAFAAGWLVPNYDHLTRLAIGVGAAAFFWQTIQNTLTAVFQANFRMDKAVICDLSGRAVILGMILWLVHIQAGLLAIMSAYLVGNLVNCALAFMLARQYVRIYPAFDFAYWKSLILEALPLGIAIVLNLMYFKIDTVMLSMMKGAEHVGIYAPSYKILEVMLIFPGIFIGSVLPIYSRYIKNQDRRAADALQKSFDFLVLAAVPIAVGIFLLSDQIIRLMAGDAFLQAGFVRFLGQTANSSTTLKVLIFSLLASFLSPVFIQFLVAGGYQKLLVVPNLIFVLFNVVLNAIFIPHGSYIAAAFTTILTEGLVLLTFIYLVWRVFGIYPRLTKFSQALFSVVWMGGVVYLFRAANLFFVILLGACVYVGVLWLVKGIDRATLKLIFKKA